MPVARSRDPNTSWEAARSVTDVQRERDFVYGVFEAFGPMTDEEMNAMLAALEPGSESGRRTRRHELYCEGKVEHTGRFKKGESGRRMIVWATSWQVRAETMKLIADGDTDELKVRVAHRLKYRKLQEEKNLC